MAKLITLQGPTAHRHFSLTKQTSLIGRRSDATVHLDSLFVSRAHARISHENGLWFVEDAGSSTGTFVNGQKLLARQPLTELDTLQVGPYLFSVSLHPSQLSTERAPTIRAEIDAQASNLNLFQQNPAYKLKVVLELTQQLARTLDPTKLLGTLLEQVLSLFPQATRGIVLLCEDESLVVYAQHGTGSSPSGQPYSRTLVQRVLDKGIGVISSDPAHDASFTPTESLLSLKLTSILCVPLLSQGRKLGVIQIDGDRSGQSFSGDDLELLTTIALQVAVVLDNVELHAQRLREERFKQELALAREIQQGFLPTHFKPLGASDITLFAKMYPAREVSGDYYDFFPLRDGRLAFFIGDVSGKGMPAALFMIAVRTLCRHLTHQATGPADLLNKLSEALANDNPAAVFVTLIHGVYTPGTGQIQLCSAAHPWPLLRRRSGAVEPKGIPTGRMVGILREELGLVDVAFRLEPGETLLMYTDGLVEASEPTHHERFEVSRLCAILSSLPTDMTLSAIAQHTRQAVAEFTQSEDPQDDMTLLLLQRKVLE